MNKQKKNSEEARAEKVTKIPLEMALKHFKTLKQKAKNKVAAGQKTELQIKLPL